MDKLQNIFDHQKLLMERFGPIENAIMDRTFPSIPVDINDRHVQLLIKEHAWRIVEEIGESLNAGMDQPQLELIDGLHFLCIMTIMLGMEKKISGNIDTTERLSYIWEHCIMRKELCRSDDMILEFIQYISMACNCLKNRPWRQTPVQTNVERFEKFFTMAFWSYIAIMRTYGLTPQDIYQGYLDKNSINHHRIDGGY